MALLTASTMIRSISLFHLTLAYFLLTNPSLIASQSVVMILGGSMQLPTPPSFRTPSPTHALAALLLVSLALTDLTASSLDELPFDAYWGAQVPVRLFFLFIVTGYVVLFKPGGMFGGGAGAGMGTSGLLMNSLVFAWGFLEVSAWFWVFVTLREERRERVRKILEAREKEEEEKLKGRM